MPQAGSSKPGSGRIKGAVSNVSVKLGDLVKIFGGNPDAKIVVNRKFVEQFGITYEFLEGQNAPKGGATREPVVVKPATKKLPVKTHNFT